MSLQKVFQKVLRIAVSIEPLWISGLYDKALGVTKYLYCLLVGGTVHRGHDYLLMISSNFLLKENTLSNPPNLKLDTLYALIMVFVDKGTKNNGSLKIKLLLFPHKHVKCIDYFTGGEKYTNR